MFLDGSDRMFAATPSSIRRATGSVCRDAPNPRVRTAAAGLSLSAADHSRIGVGLSYWRSMVVRRTSAAVACLLALAGVPVGAGDLVAETVRRPAVTWKELRFAARKMGISASIVINLASAPGGTTGRTGSPDGAVPSATGGDDLVLESTTRLPGRTFVAREVLDPASSAARKIVDTETGAKHHRKTYTLTGRGFELAVLEPATAMQMLLPPERWTRETRTFTAYPVAVPAGAVVTGPAGLIYVASAADLSSPGDSVTTLALIQTEVERVTVRAEGFEPAGLDFQEESPAGIDAVQERRAVVRLVAHGLPVDPTASSVFRLFGLEGDIEILWDPARRLPVRMAGQVKMLGRVEVHLVAVTLR